MKLNGLGLNNRSAIGERRARPGDIRRERTPVDPGAGIVDRRAETCPLTDLGAIVYFLSDDLLGQSRETVTPGVADLGPYRRAFKTLDADPVHLLLVAANGDGVVGTMQLSFIPGLSRRGALRAQIEAVRYTRATAAKAGNGDVRVGNHRGKTPQLCPCAADNCQTRGDAHRFYERLGCTASHEGFKLQL